MNTKQNKELFENYEVVALKADKGKIPDEVKDILTELGNPKELIPFYAIYGPGISKPITLEALITHGQVADAIEKAMGDAAAELQVSVDKNNNSGIN